MKPKYPAVGVGIMTGTSCDGIDIAIIEIFSDNPFRFKLLKFETIAFPKSLNAQLNRISDWKIQDVSRIHFEIGKVYASAVRKVLSEGNIAQINFIGCHGQTVFHSSGKHTFQIGTPAFLAAKFCVPVVHDFRSKDIALGGTGAPLVPKVDEILFRDLAENRICLNIGGIANVTILPANPNSEILAFDTGPGMALADRFAEKLFSDWRNYHWIEDVASCSKLHHDLWRVLTAHTFIKKYPPKSTGAEEFGDNFVAKLIEQFPDFRDEPLSWMRTILKFTSWAVHENVCNLQLRDFSNYRVIASGGGIHNKIIWDELARYFNPNPIDTTEKFGVSVDGKEAIAFAILAHETLSGKTGNITTATGAKKETILGSITF